MSARKKAASNRNRQKVSSKANYELAQLANENAKKAMVLTTDACNLRTELEEQAFELKVQCISSLMNRVKLKMAMKANPPPVGMTTKSKLRRKSLPKKKSDDECAELLEPFKKALALQEEKVKIAKTTKTLVNNETKQFHERYALHTANADKIIFSEEAIQQRVAARLKKLAEKKANLDELVRTLNNEHTPSVEPEEIQESVKPKRTRTEKPVAVKAQSIPVESPIVIESGNETYCYCNRISFGRMVACDNPACKIEWFHFDCVGLTEEPVGAWFCRECHQSNAPPPGKRPRGRPRKNPLPLPTTSNFILPPRSPTKDLQHVPEVTIRVSPKTLDSFQPTLKKRVSKPTRRLLL